MNLRDPWQLMDEWDNYNPDYLEPSFLITTSDESVDILVQTNHQNWVAVQADKDTPFIAAVVAEAANMYRFLKSIDESAPQQKPVRSEYNNYIEDEDYFFKFHRWMYAEEFVRPILRRIEYRTRYMTDPEFREEVRKAAVSEKHEEFMGLEEWMEGKGLI